MKTPTLNRNHTHNPTPIDRERFRAQATGVGSTVGKSHTTGAIRAAEVSEYMPAAQRKALPRHGAGYPAPLPDVGDSGFMDSTY